MTKDTDVTANESASQLIDGRINELGDWRGETLARIRDLIKQADPDVIEEWKWQKATSPGVPVWSHAVFVCTGETDKAAVKMTFAKGASLKDPAGLFNSSLDGNTRRAIDFHEGDVPDETAFKALIEAYIFSGQEPIRADVLKCLGDRPSILQAREIGERIISEMKEYVEVFLKGMVA